MALNDNVKNRLLNGKFTQAQRALAEQVAAGELVPTELETDTITALAQTFGNPGWFEGYMADIINAVMVSLGVVVEDDELA